MAANMTGTRVEESLVIGTGVKRSQGRTPRIGAVGVIAATLALLLVGSVVLHSRSSSHSAVPAIPRAVTSQQARFLENNTTNLPNTVAAESVPRITTRAETQSLANNATNLPNAVPPEVQPAVVPSARQRFLEVNTMMPSAGLSRLDTETVPPMIGHPR
jgi:hypothetical protein